MKNFRLHVVLRLVSIALMLTVAVYLFLETTSYVAGGIVVAVILAQVAGLITYVDKTNRDVGRFLHAVRYSDFSQSFTAESRGASFKALNAAFSEVMDDFRRERAEKEESYRYLQTVMQHVGVGLISYEADGTVELINTAAKRLLRVPYLKNIANLKDMSPRLVEVLGRIRSGEKALVEVADDDDLLQLVIYGTTFKLRERQYTLVSIQDIQAELEEKEIDAWQKLTRVLTHEIMNSITPISSLAGTANELIADLDAALPSDTLHPETAETLADVRGAMRTIEKRSQNLLGFVSDYRSLTRIPKPQFQIVKAAALIDGVLELLGPDLRTADITLSTHISPESLDVTADPELVEQVLINLVKNAKESVQQRSDAVLSVRAFMDRRGRPTIQVEDNGPGIVPEAMAKIFIPFFTTKKEGSGIGLSLSRQIMRQHGGTLNVSSTPDVRTVFTLRF